MSAYESPVPRAPLGLIGTFDSEQSPWFSEPKMQMYRARPGIGLLCSNHHTGLGYVDEVDEPVYARFLSFGKIHKAFLATADKLCCADKMLQDGYRAGCAKDADVILQQAVYVGQMWE